LKVLWANSSQLFFCITQTRDARCLIGTCKGAVHFRVTAFLHLTSTTELDPTPALFNSIRLVALIQTLSSFANFHVPGSVIFQVLNFSRPAIWYVIFQPCLFQYLFFLARHFRFLQGYKFSPHTVRKFLTRADQNWHATMQLSHRASSKTVLL